VVELVNGGASPAPGNLCRALTNRQSASPTVSLTMKISGPSSTASSAPAKAARGATPGVGFSLGAQGAGEAAGVKSAAGVSGVASVDALLALQAVEDPMQRRRRAVSRAGRILDALDGLKIALLEGEASPATLQALMTAVKEERGATDDVRLQGVLNEIETRAAVELAKLARATAA
jgi:hypothetical protein